MGRFAVEFHSDHWMVCLFITGGFVCECLCGVDFCDFGHQTIWSSSSFDVESFISIFTVLSAFCCVSPLSVHVLLIMDHMIRLLSTLCIEYSLFDSFECHC